MMAPSKQLSAQQYADYNHKNNVSFNPESNFSVIVFNFDKIDLLSLNYQKNTRVFYHWDKMNDMQSSYIAP